MQSKQVLTILAVLLVAGFGLVWHSNVTAKIRIAEKSKSNCQTQIRKLAAQNEELEEELEGLREQLNVPKSAAAKPSEKPSEAAPATTIPAKPPASRPGRADRKSDELVALRHDQTELLAHQGNPATYWNAIGANQRERECEAVFGMTLVDQWRKTRKSYCESKAGHQPDQSSLTCYRYQQLRHSAQDIMCLGRNIAIDLGRVSMSGKSSMYGEDGQFTFNAGTFQAACQWTEHYSNGHFPMCQKDVINGFQLVEKVDGCDTMIENPVALVIRYEFKNLFHQMTDFINVYLGAAVTGASLDEMQVVLLDNHPDGPFMDIWRALSPAHEVLRAKDLKGKVCMQQPLFPVLGYGAPIAKDIDRSNECRDGSLVQSFVRRVLLELDLLDTPIPTQPVITFISRKDYDGRVISRKITNEDQLVAEMKSKLSGGVVNQVDFARISFREQLEVIRKTNILIGMHGAGLSHLLFLPKEAIVVELFQGGQPKHYRNFAKWSDKQYMAYNTNGNVDINDFMRALDGAVRIARSFNDGHGACGFSC
eukprot:TRINITY_DN5569_c0_g1_i1.p1 TRINITY_DN5569_c0_g1~~TRINITY_DN5569_c0_g1_i1.p1  ORF type:complete len:536 (-),score=115.97 TRINITY_DN5569_c0_g1_i1:33-1640(-)